MFERRLAAEGSSSPVTSRHAESRRGSTVADTDGKPNVLPACLIQSLSKLRGTEPRSSPAPSRGRKSAPGARQPARATRSTKLQVEIGSGSGSQGKASDEDGESEEETGANNEGEEVEEGSDGAKDSEGEEEEEAEEEKGGPRSTRAQTSKSKQKDSKASTSTGTRRTGRRR